MDFRRLLKQIDLGNAKYIEFCFIFLALFLLSYPMLYFSYKYFTPSIGYSDYFNYYKMYKDPLDLHAAVSPLVFRQISAILTNLTYNAGAHYNTTIVYSANKHDMGIFFSALLVNYVALLGSATLVSALIYGALRRNLPLALVGGVTVLLSFYATGGVLTGLTEGVSWLIFTLIFLCVSLRRWLVVAIGLILLSTFQRETISIAFLAMAAVGFFTEKKSRLYFAPLMAASLCSFLLYIAMNIWISAAPRHGYELSLQFVIHNIENIRSNSGFLLQSIASQNVLVLLLGVTIINSKRRVIDVEYHMVFAAVAALTILGILAGEGNSTGRIVAILTPALAVLFARQLNIISARSEAELA